MDFIAKRNASVIRGTPCIYMYYEGESIAEVNNSCIEFNACELVLKFKTRTDFFKTYFIFHKINKVLSIMTR